MVKNYLVISDTGFPGPSLCYSIVSSISDNIIWFSSENPLVVNRIVEAYGRKQKLKVFNSRDINIANLNEINIILSKSMDEFKGKTSVCLTMISELILIHNLEKTYLFLSNLIKKVESKGGTVVGLMIAGAQSKRDEILISRLFSDVFHVKIENGKENELKLRSESIIDGRFNFSLKVNGYSVDLHPSLKDYIIGIK